MELSLELYSSEFRLWWICGLQDVSASGFIWCPRLGLGKPASEFQRGWDLLRRFVVTVTVARPNGASLMIPLIINRE